MAGLIKKLKPLEYIVIKGTDWVIQNESKNAITIRIVPENLLEDLKKDEVQHGHQN